jgi:M6 family metalloprotease-like protein
MKKTKAIIFTIGLIIGMLFMVIPAAKGDYVEKLAYTIVQPDGDTVHCFITGDEYSRQLHDSLGYTIIIDPETRWFVYATSVNGRLEPTTLIAGQADPQTANIAPGLFDETEEEDEWLMEQLQGPLTLSPSKGRVNHLVIPISFSDTIITDSYAPVFAMFNDTLPAANSVSSFYDRASYHKLRLLSHFYPQQPAGVIVLASVMDTHVRGYYRKNTDDPVNGYSTPDERKIREWSMLKDAIATVEPLIDPALNLDVDSDGFVDNVTFILAGERDHASGVLWPHKWQFGTLFPYPEIRGLEVKTYSLCIARGLNVSTIAHETFHTMGAPDLYRPNGYRGVTPVGKWNLMAANGLQLKQMDAFMKKKHGKWQNIPVLDRYGVYTLKPLNGGDSSSAAYQILSESADQSFLLEYRRMGTIHDYDIPGTGLLISRIDERYHGNIRYNGITEFDEVFVYRPQAVTDLLDSAAFVSIRRDSLTSHTDPAPKLTDGTLSNKIRIEHIVMAGDSLQFYFGPEYARHIHTNFTADTLGVGAVRTVQLTDCSSSDGDITLRRWKIEGGIPSEIEGVRNVKAYFRTSGAYKVTLITTNIHNRTDSLVRTVTIP